ncbi:hypothetical protein BDN71DRAFT_1451024 [Pleurotus eryngii]|uniref:Uncharacterized protein n=1 Tax=Pleurotus eryngii TaxID=5323 RepID=A0A9P6DE27_PLEER|nr:hypothetical protein BDN71DRAFT_1451024 [Pleurotus eryngii]
MEQELLVLNGVDGVPNDARTEYLLAGSMSHPVRVTERKIRVLSWHEQKPLTIRKPG